MWLPFKSIVAVSQPPELNVICVPSVSVRVQPPPEFFTSGREFTGRVGIRAARHCRAAGKPQRSAVVSRDRGSPHPTRR